MFNLSKGALQLSAACFAKAKPLHRLGGSWGCHSCPCSTMVAAAQKPATWDGTGSQAELMHRDECITVDGADAILGSANKFDAHRFTPQQPAGRLHRAFSVFLFDADNRLLLQQRASTKITFPGVWTNTCCSHPLHGREPPEVDGPEDVAAGTVMGAKRAAVRKLQHELGIPPRELPLAGFRFLTRLHYCAPDTGTYGPEAEWGEHEVDYILFAKAAVSLAENADEVAATKYVDLAELKNMMRHDSGLRWSPWFRIIADNFLEKWWGDLDGVLSGQAHQDFSTIHRIL